MTQMRKVLIQIEVNTCLSVEEIKDLQSLIFGRQRSDQGAEKQRTTIKRHMPAGINHDVRGVILSVETKVSKEKAAKKARSKKAKAAAAS